jgi:hypothetical protein
VVPLHEHLVQGLSEDTGKTRWYLYTNNKKTSVVVVRAEAISKRTGKSLNKSVCYTAPVSLLEQRYSTFFVRVPPDIISLQLCNPKVIGA